MLENTFKLLFAHLSVDSNPPPQSNSHTICLGRGRAFFASNKWFNNHCHNQIYEKSALNELSSEYSIQPPPLFNNSQLKLPIASTNPSNNNRPRPYVPIQSIGDQSHSGRHRIKLIETKLSRLCESYCSSNKLEFNSRAYTQYRQRCTTTTTK